MEKIISIHDQKSKLAFTAGLCKVGVLGGFKIRVENFSMTLISEQTAIKLAPQKTLPIQSYHNSRRARRIFHFDILNSGIYIIEFLNPEDLFLQYSNLPILSRFSNAIPNSNIQVMFKN